MSNQPEALFRAASLARDIGLPQDFVAKILVQLRQGEFVTSRRGRNGGYLLACDPAQTSIIEIVSFMDRSQEEPDCASTTGEKKTGHGVNCLLHDYWKSVHSLRQEVLGGHTIADLSKSCSRHNKLKESSLSV
jgi:Rrf2 family protein